MTDRELLDTLHALGVDETSWRSVVLLPLIHVAWADGAVQGPEVRLIREIARAWGLAEGPTGAVLDRWLAVRPSDDVIARGRTALVQLANRHRGLGSELPDDVLETVEAFCLGVARSAGGLFHVLFTVDARERAALEEIAGDLRSGTERFLRELPTPDGGRFEDL